MGTYIKYKLAEVQYLIRLVWQGLAAKQNLNLIFAVPMKLIYSV